MKKVGCALKHTKFNLPLERGIHTPQKRKGRFNTHNP